MKDGPLQFTLRRLQALVFSRRFWAIMLAVAVILGLTGPFGTFEQLPLLPRFGYWLTLALVTFLTGYAAIGLVLRHFPGSIEPRPARIALAGLAAGIPITIIVEVLNHLLFGDPAGSSGQILGLYINCSLIAMAISFLFGLADGGTTQADGRGVETAEPARSNEGISGAAAPARADTSSMLSEAPLVERLPHRLRGRLLYLSMQDHYVEIHTDKGSGLVLMRFGDAVRETGDIAGLRIHRSHWVALDAVEGSKRKDGRLFVMMRDGVLLPVSRTAQPDVKAAGIG